MKAHTMMIAVATLLLAAACTNKQVTTEKNMNTLSFNQEQGSAVDGRTDVVCAQSAWPLGNPNEAFAQYFTGNSYLAVLDTASGLCNVTFEPGCRNNWHVHHGAVQMLICVSGRGWYQEWGKPAVELKPGVTIAVPEGVKHWHGAAKDSLMQHLTYHTDAKPGNSNEWLEPVSDEQYNTLQ